MKTSIRVKLLIIASFCVFTLYFLNVEYSHFAFTKKNIEQNLIKDSVLFTKELNTKLINLQQAGLKISHDADLALGVKNGQFDLIFRKIQKYNLQSTNKIIVMDNNQEVFLRSDDEYSFGGKIKILYDESFQIIYLDNVKYMAKLIPIFEFGKKRAGSVIMLFSLDKTFKELIFSRYEFHFNIEKTTDVLQNDRSFNYHEKVSLGNEGVVFNLSTFRENNYLVENARNSLIKSSIFSISFLVMFFILLNYLFHKNFLSPLKQLVGYVQNEESVKISDQIESSEFKILANVIEELRITNREKQVSLEKTLEELRHERLIVEEDNNLLRVLSHDLANPLGVVLFACKIKNGKNDLEGNDLLWSRVLRASQTMNSILDLVRNMMTSKNDEFNLILEPLTIEFSFENAKFIFEKILNEKNINLKLIETNKRNCFLAEKRSFENSVLNNVISNAIKYSYKNSSIDIETIEQSDLFVIKVKDYGKGMTAIQISNLFGVGAKESTFGTEGEKGTGLGFTVVKAYMKKYGGSVNVESRAIAESPTDHGTTVSLFFKLSNSIKS